MKRTPTEAANALACIDHTARWQEGCSECHLVVRLYRAGWHKMQVHSNQPATRSAWDTAHAERRVQELRGRRLTDLARVCEQIVADHARSVAS